MGAEPAGADGSAPDIQHEKLYMLFLYLRPSAYLPQSVRQTFQQGMWQLFLGTVGPRTTSSLPEERVSGRCTRRKIPNSPGGSHLCLEKGKRLSLFLVKSYCTPRMSD
jgi:hypothetical protein